MVSYYNSKINSGQYKKSWHKFKVRAGINDWRDFSYASSNNPLREVVDLRPWSSPVENQAHLGSCTGQAVVGAYELMVKKQYPEQFEDLSRLFVYYNARLIEGNVDEDEGAYIRDAVKAVNKYGICAESFWPYDIELFAMTPPISSYTDARNRTIKKYYRVEGLKNILDALSNDYPVVAGMQVYSSFDDIEAIENFILPMPTVKDDIIGGHAVVIVGYDLLKKLVLCRNSFGPDWCRGGHFWVPFEYVRNNFSDCWIFDIDVKR